MEKEQENVNPTFCYLLSYYHWVWLINPASWSCSSNNGWTREKGLCFSYLPLCDGINALGTNVGLNMNNNILSAIKSGLMGLYYEGVNRVCLYIGKMGQSIPLLRRFRFDLLKPLNPRHSLLSSV